MLDVGFCNHAMQWLEILEILEQKSSQGTYRHVDDFTNPTLRV